jgi:hypothetical protein
MAVIRDVMPVFELFQPATVADTLNLLDRYGAEAWIMAGGLDTFDWLKDRAKRTNIVIDLSQVAELRGIKEVNGGLEIGALTTLTEVGRHPVVREQFGCCVRRPTWSPRPRSATRGRWAATSRRIRAAGITAAAGPATGPAGTSVMRIRRRRSTASTRFSMPTAAWR